MSRIRAPGRRDVTALRRRAFVAALGLLLATTAVATTYLALSPASVLATAEVVVLGRVADVRSESTDDGVRTEVTIRVEEWLKRPAADADGGLEDELVFSVLGGEAEGRRVIVAGAPRWLVGDDVLVALSGEEQAVSPVVGFTQGVWRVESDSLATPDGRFLALDDVGSLVTAASPSPVASVLSAVRRITSGEAGEAGEERSGAEGGLSGDGAAGGAGPDGPAGDDRVPGADEGEAGPARPEDDLPEPADEPAGDGEPAQAPLEVSATYDVVDEGGPLLLSDRVGAAAAAWERAGEGAVSVTRQPGAAATFRYAPEGFLPPWMLTLTVAEAEEITVLVAPEARSGLDTALAHEIGGLLGLPAAPEGVMAPAVADNDLAPGAADIAELSALARYAPADLDRDGRVGFSDLVELASQRGRTGVNLPADLDGDGDVDDDDFALLSEEYGFVPPATDTPGGQSGSDEGAPTNEPADEGGVEDDQPDGELPDGGEPDGGEQEDEEPDGEGDGDGDGAEEGGA